ncbi:MAG: CBS domain-containing protein [Gammaproteobacteria bacterium]|jgi:CBS domain-containing protein
MDIRTILADKGHGVETVGPDASLAEVIKTLVEKKIGSVLVINGDEILGIVNERSIVKAICIHGADAVDQAVSEIMDTNLMVCSPNSSIDSVRTHMSKMNMRHIPVVDNGKLVGMVSIGDVLKYRISELKHGGGSRFQHWFETDGVRPLRPDR